MQQPLIDRLASRFSPTETRNVIGQLVEDSTTSLPSGFVKRVLDLRDSTPEMARVGQPGYVHLSELVKLCARQHCLMQDGGIATELPIVGAHRVMWKIGRAVENHVRAQLIDGLPTEVMGKWECHCGTSHHVGHKPATHLTCRVCNGYLRTYRELPLFDDENGVVGNPDIIIRNQQLYVPVEIKSMVVDQWDELRSPLGDHIMQAVGYRRLLQVNNFQVHNDVVIIYTAKDFRWGSPYKEYHVRVTPTLERQLDDLFAEAKRVKEWNTNNRLPERTCCSSRNSRRAKVCPVAGRCFERS